MPNMRFTFVPHPITGTAAEICRKYLQGNDPVTGKPVLDEIVAALTKPLTGEDTKTGFIERPTPRLVEPDTEGNLHRSFLENGWLSYRSVIRLIESVAYFFRHWSIVDPSSDQKKAPSGFSESPLINASGVNCVG